MLADQGGCRESKGVDCSPSYLFLFSIVQTGIYGFFLCYGSKNVRVTFPPFPRDTGGCFYTRWIIPDLRRLTWTLAGASYSITFPPLLLSAQILTLKYILTNGLDGLPTGRIDLSRPFIIRAKPFLRAFSHLCCSSRSFLLSFTLITRKAPRRSISLDGPPFLFLFIFIFGIYTPCYAWPWISPLPPFTREGEAESATWVRGTPAVYRGGFFDYTTATPRTGGTESDTSRNYRDGRAVRYE